MSENKRRAISVPQLPDESFVTNRRIYLFCAGICEKCKPRNEGCQKKLIKMKKNRKGD